VDTFGRSDGGNGFLGVGSEVFQIRKRGMNCVSARNDRKAETMRVRTSRAEGRTKKERVCQKHQLRLRSMGPKNNQRTKITQV